jgi:TonB-dependent receptor
MRGSTVLVSVAAGILATLLAAIPAAAQTKPADAPSVAPTQEGVTQMMPCGCLQVTPEGLAALRQHDAATIVSVIAGAQIPSTPPSMVPDALAPLVSVSLDRVLGEGRFVRIRGLEPRWSSVQVDGDRLPSVDGQSRATPLDILPADFFELMQVSRTLTADMDGDAIGGIVNLVPRQPTAQPRGSVSLSGGYRGLRGDADNVGLNGMIGRRFDNGRIGIAAGGSFLRESLAGNGVRARYAGDNFLLDGFDVRSEIIDRTRGGGEGIVDVKLSDRSQLAVTGFVSQLRDRDDLRGFGFSQYTYDFARDVSEAPSVETLWNANVRAQHQVRDDLTFDARVGVAQGRLHEDQGIGATYRLLSPRFQPNANGLLIDPSTLQFTLLNDDPSQYFPSASKYVVDNTARDTTLTASANVTTRVLKFGVKARSLSLSHDWNAGQTSVNVPFTSVLEHGFDSGPILDGRYSLGPTIDLAGIRDAGVVGITYSTQVNTFSDYSGRETTLAGYVMGDLAIGSRLKLQPGLRYEWDRRGYDGFRIARDWEPTYTITPTSSTETRGEWLPMIAMRAALTTSTTLRVSGTRTLTRPDFDVIVPTTQYYINTLSATENPALRSTMSWNGDVMLDQQVAQGSGRLSVGLFGKRITDPVYLMVVNNVFQPQNGDRATLAGLEMGYTQPLRFLPGVWSGFGLSASYTLSHSNAIVPNRIGNGTSAVFPDRPGHNVTLPGLPRHLGHVGATYDRARLSARLLLTMRSESMQSPGNFAWYDLFNAGRTQLDTSLSYRVAARLSAFVDLFNLTDASTRMYQNDATHPVREESYGRWAVFGARFSF